MNARLVRGALWGTVATVAMTLVHIGIWTMEGRLSVHSMTTQMMPSMIIAKMFGEQLPVSTHLLLALLIHLGYGAFWGAMLFALTKRVTLWNGLAMGAFLYFGSHIFLFPLFARGGSAGGSLQGIVASWFSWFSMATHITYGATLGFFGGRQDRAAEAARASMDRLGGEPVSPQAGTPVRADSFK